MFILNVLFYFVLQSTFYMNKDKALESVNEIKELMEKSSKFISVSGLAAILAGIYALAGAYIGDTSYHTRDVFNRHIGILWL